MLLEEYDEKAEREYLRKEAIEEGRKEGMEKGLKEGLEEGMILGSFKILGGLMDKGILSLEQAEEQLGDRKEEFVRWYQGQR